MPSDVYLRADPAVGEEAQSSVSWGAVLTGAVTAFSMSFVLLAIAGGFGLQVAGAWPGRALAPGAFTPVVGSVLVTIQVLSSALGGYLAGRLRSKWLHVHDHEVHFRDTAHGLLVWAASTAFMLVLAVAASPPAPVGAVLALSQVERAATATQLPPSVVAYRMERATAQASLFLGVGLLTSAFAASVAAALGGLRRDEMYVLHRAGGEG